MRSPECVPHVKPYLKTQKIDTSFTQNNIKSGRPDMCPRLSKHTYRLQSHSLPMNHQEQLKHFKRSTTKYYKFNIGGFQSEIKGSTTSYKPWAQE